MRRLKVSAEAGKPFEKQAFFARFLEGFASQAARCFATAAQGESEFFITPEVLPGCIEGRLARLSAAFQIFCPTP
ncbi:MAG: hypothetical protein DBX55_07585 [Verrucomicrobia bacterium]|nr:MAG: hypothetical protein DBX55_07585 [Verrucomicrobiota bacterium]